MFSQRYSWGLVLGLQWETTANGGPREANFSTWIPCVPSGHRSSAYSSHSCLPERMDSRLRSNLSEIFTARFPPPTRARGHEAFVPRPTRINQRYRPKFRLGRWDRFLIYHPHCHWPSPSSQPTLSVTGRFRVPMHGRAGPQRGYGQ